MSYSDFTIEDIKSRFNLRLDEGLDLFSQVAAVKVSDVLRHTLSEGVPLALQISTERARSELIIAPVLMEARLQAKPQVSLFVGMDFTVDAEQGLRGICDYLMSRSSEQLTIEAPVIAIVEAKNENMKAGISQCLAEMVAAQLFNQRRGEQVSVVYGVVTTGNNWKFLRLSGKIAAVDRAEYHISDVGRVVGTLIAMLKAEAA
jgi:hypothetical protein